MICWKVTKNKTPVVHEQGTPEKTKTLCGLKTTGKGAGTWVVMTGTTHEVTCKKCKHVLEGKKENTEVFSEVAQKNLKDFGYYCDLHNKMQRVGSDKLSLAEHAEMWWLEGGNPLPEKNTQAWRDMYATWIAFAFKEKDL